jgi:hypothetical protein
VQKVGSTVGYFYFATGFRRALLLSIPAVARTIRSIFLLAQERLLLFAQAAVGAFEKAGVATFSLVESVSSSGPSWK